MGRDKKTLIDDSTSTVRLICRRRFRDPSLMTERANEASLPELRPAILAILCLIYSMILPIIITVADGSRSVWLTDPSDRSR